jgi:hypothetical protein
MGLFDFFKTKKETRVNDVFNDREKKLLTELTSSVGDNGIDIKNHILNNGILNDDYFNLLESMLQVSMAEAMLCGQALNKDFSALYNKIKKHCSPTE